MESLFLNPSLIWIGLPLLGLPILIHLINLMRHKRIQWAAMEFLLAAYKKSKTWVILKQLLLLLMRIAAVAAIMFIVAQPIVQGGLDFLGGNVSHHIVLLDDSYSMSDVHGSETAYEIARRGVMSIASKAASARGAQEFTLLRFSEAAKKNPVPDTNAMRVAADFESTLEPILGRHEASQTAVGPEAAIDAIGKLLDEGRDETRIVYIVSDFRQKEWESAEGLRDKLASLRDRGIDVKLVRTIDKENDNITLTSLEAVQGTRAKDVPIELEVKVKNNGKIVRDVTVSLKSDGKSIPDLIIPKVQPDEEETRKFSVSFPAAGPHWVEASLSADEVAADNYRYWSIDLPLDIPVLICTPQPQSQDAYYLDITLKAQLDEIPTGIITQIETPQYLGTHDLNRFQSIYLTNVSRLQENEVAALEEYVRNGGGLAVFLGEDTQPRWFNEAMYQAGAGLSPVPISSKVELLPSPDTRTPDLIPNTEHPVFRIFSYSPDEFVNQVKVGEYWALERDFNAKDDQILCSLRNNAPLVVENRTFGTGRVVVYLMAADRSMSNWPSNPSYLVSMMVLQSYLSKQKEASFDIGAPFELNNLPPDEYNAEVEFVRQGQDPMSVRVQATTQEAAAGQPQTPETSTDGSGTAAPEQPPADHAGAITPVAFRPQDQQPPAGDGGTNASGTNPAGSSGSTLPTRAAKLEETDLAGVYSAKLSKIGAASPEVVIRSYNVDPDEGRLAISPPESLAATLNLKGLQILNVNDLGGGSGAAQQSNISQYLLYGLIILLIGEQILAYSASYHTPVPGGAR